MDKPQPWEDLDLYTKCIREGLEQGAKKMQDKLEPIEYEKED